MLRKLRKYQIKAFGYFRVTPNPALFMDMRLGKTLVTIRAINLYIPQDFKQLKILIVAPNSALGSWIEELKKEKEPKPTILKGPRKKRLERLNEENKWFLINKEGHISIPEIAKKNWDAVVLDESTFIKNPKARVTKFFTKNFKTVPHKIILTGTPNPESDLDFYCQMQFLYGSFLGYENYWEFRRAFCIKGLMGYNWSLPPNNCKKIIDGIGRKAFVLKRSDAGVKEKITREIRQIEMPPRIRKIYKKIEEEFVLELESKEIKSTIWAIGQYQMLRQLCGGFAEDEFVWNGKAKELCNLLLGELKQEQVVVWFDYNKELRMIEKILPNETETITGENKPETRDFIRRRFNAGKFRILLVQQRVAQMGFDLSGSDTAIYYSEPLGYLSKKQTEDRVISLNKKNNILIVNLLVKNSVDEDSHFSTSAKGLRSSASLSKILKKSIMKRVLS